MQARRHWSRGLHRRAMFRRMVRYSSSVVVKSSMEQVAERAGLQAAGSCLQESLSGETQNDCDSRVATAKVVSVDKSKQTSGGWQLARVQFVPAAWLRPGSSSVSYPYGRDGLVGAGGGEPLQATGNTNRKSAMRDIRNWTHDMAVALALLRLPNLYLACGRGPRARRCGAGDWAKMSGEECAWRNDNGCGGWEKPTDLVCFLGPHPTRSVNRASSCGILSEPRVRGCDAARYPREGSRRRSVVARTRPATTRRPNCEPTSVERLGFA